MDLSDAIDNLKTMAVEATELQKIETKDPRRLTFVVPKDGSVKVFELPPPPRAHRVHTLSDLIKFSNAAASHHVSPAAPVVWHEHGGVLLTLNDGDRRDTVSLNLIQGRQFTVIKGLVSAEGLNQGQLVKLLKRDLRDTVVEQSAGDLITKLAEIRFRSTDDLAGNVQRRRESIDANVVHELANVEAIPETVVLSVPVYDNPDLRESTVVTIGMSLDIDLEDRHFVFKPLPGELENAVHAAQHVVRERLEKELADGTPVYYGQV